MNEAIYRLLPLFTVRVMGEKKSVIMTVIPLKYSFYRRLPQEIVVKLPSITVIYRHLTVIYRQRYAVKNSVPLDYIKK